MTRLDKFGVLPHDHVPDLLAPGLKVVFCGTALGRVSAERRAYYAHPGNLFWRTLHNTGLTPRLLLPREYPELLRYGIGLTDLCKAHYGNDAELPPDAFDVAALRDKMRACRPRILAFSSKTGAAAFLGKATGEVPYGIQPETVGETRIYTLSSPSGQARVFWNQGAWQDLANAVKAM